MTLLSHTIALVTGASSGLGHATARHLTRNGARVIMADLREPPVSDDSFLKNSLFCHMDVTSEDSVKAALDNAENTFGEPINAAINCAGIAVAKKTLSKKGPHPLDDFERTIQINLLGSFNVARLAAERMDRRQPDQHGLKGCIINTASIAAYEGQIGQVAYAASKGGIVGMTLPMARELASYGIRVMTIVSIKSSRDIYRCLLWQRLCLPLIPVCIIDKAPGLFETPLLEGLPPDVKEQLGASVPCPSRLGKPDEFANLVGTILTSPYLNGSVIRLDGALRMPP